MSSLKRRKLSAVLSAFMAIILVIGLAACAGREPEPPPNPPSESPSSASSRPPPSFANPLEVPGGPDDPPLVEIPSFTDVVAEKYGINDDTVGWLYMPNTFIDDVVVWRGGVEYWNFYLRRNFQREYYFDGIYYADFRTTWGNPPVGRREDLARNTVIYGHSMEDIPGIEDMSLEQIAAIPQSQVRMFTGFKKLLNEEFATANPYLFFSSRHEDMAWEIFSVHYTNIHVPYNHPTQTNTYNDGWAEFAARFSSNDAAWAAVIADARARSLWDYDVNVTPNDRIITFSTCIYNIDGTPLASNRDSDYRFVVMARLVGRDVPLKQEASVTRNPNPVSGRTRL